MSTILLSEKADFKYDDLVFINMSEGTKKPGSKNIAVLIVASNSNYVLFFPIYEFFYN